MFEHIRFECRGRCESLLRSIRFSTLCEDVWQSHFTAMLWFVCVFSTAIALRCKDGVVFGVEKLIQSKLHETSANQRIFHIDRHIGMVRCQVQPCNVRLYVAPTCHIGVTCNFTLLLITSEYLVLLHVSVHLLVSLNTGQVGQIIPKMLCYEVYPTPTSTSLCFLAREDDFSDKFSACLGA